MPEGPAAGRVEAKRRALTTPSTAPASNARWFGSGIWIRKGGAPFRETLGASEPISVRFIRRFIPADLETKTRTPGGAFVVHDLCAQTATCGTTNDGVNDPVSTAWGHSTGRTPGSFTPSLVHRPRHQH
jgi:hypothetical protein